MQDYLESKIFPSVEKSKKEVRTAEVEEAVPMILLSKIPMHYLCNYPN
jgi:hypothetical protein